MLTILLILYTTFLCFMTFSKELMGSNQRSFNLSNQRLYAEKIYNQSIMQAQRIPSYFQKNNRNNGNLKLINPPIYNK